MTIIAHQELTSSQSSITFSSIPQTFTDLYLVVSARSSGNQGGGNGNDLLYLLLNGSSSDFSRRILQGGGSSVASYSNGDNFMGYISGSGYTASTFGNTSIYIPNYTAATSKSISVDSVSENNGTQAFSNISASIWTNNSAVTSLGLDILYGDFVSGSSATLYGILKGSDGSTTVS